MDHCIFCRIIRGELPCSKIYEDDQVLSFLDINPVNPGHALVVPKKHYETFFETPVEELNACMAATKKIADAVFKGMKASGLNIIQNNFRPAGQTVFHIHFHIIPRHERDRFFTSWPGKPYQPGEVERVIERVKAGLL